MAKVEEKEEFESFNDNDFLLDENNFREALKKLYPNTLKELRMVSDIDDTQMKALFFLDAFSLFMKDENPTKVLHNSEERILRYSIARNRLGRREILELLNQASDSENKEKKSTNLLSLFRF